MRGSSACLEADFLADSFRQGLEHFLVSQENLLVPQKNGPDLRELGFDASKALISSRRQSHEVGLEACLVANELGLGVDKPGLGAGEVCHRFLEPSIAASPGHACLSCVRVYHDLTVHRAFRPIVTAIRPLLSPES